MTRVSFILWVALPYVSLTIFLIGHIWRYRYDQFTWTTRSTQLVERRLLKWGSMLFHYGGLAAIGGHILGLLVPEHWTKAIGVSEHVYHTVSVSAGTVAGLACVTGLLILLYRRLAVARVAATTTYMDRAIFILLALIISLGMAETVGANLLGGGYDYRRTVAVWFRGIFVFDPHESLMVGAPFVYQLHAICAWLLCAFWPFSRLVHAWSMPITYFGRAHILYRNRRHTRMERPHPSHMKLYDASERSDSYNRVAERDV